MKKFIIGMLTGIILTVSGTAFANGQIEEITAYLRNDLGITLDGKDLVLDDKPIIYNGSTYLPVREMMEYMGKLANWNGKTNKVDITSSSEKSISAVTPEGKYIILGQQTDTHYKDIELTIGHQIDEPEHISIFNHSGLMSKEQIDLPFGKATLLEFGLGQSAAFLEENPDSPQKDTIVYWVCVQQPIDDPQAKYKTVNTYYLQAIVTGNENAARDEVIEVAKTWNPPI